MNKLPITIGLFICTCLASCVSWDIGGCIRHAGDRYQGIDLGPSGSTLPKGATAPEVTYRLNRPLVTGAGFIGGKIYTPTAEAVQPTGRTATVEHGQDAEVLSADKHLIRQTGTLQSPGITRRILAAPFDFIIDPALDVVTSPFMYFFQK